MGFDGTGETARRHWEVLVVTALALAVRLIHLDTVHFMDDYYHLLAAESWLREGAFSIVGGPPYERAALFTYLVAGFMYLFGETLWVARLPAALAGAALVGVLFVWLRHVAGRPAAWFGTVLLCFDPVSIAVSQHVRFYSLHSLVFLLGAIGVYHLVVRRPTRPVSALLLVGIATAFALAYHLQHTTVIGIVALTVWLALDWGPRAVRRVMEDPRVGAAWAGAGILVGLVAVLALVEGGTAAAWWNRFRSAPVWAAERRDDLGYYFRRLRSAFPLFVGLFPLAALLAVARSRRPALFAGALFAVPFVLHSFAAFKEERYISYAMPFFFAIWGIALAAVAPAAVAATKQAIVRATTVRPPDGVLRAGSWALLAVVLAGLVATNPAFLQNLRRVTARPLPAEMRQANWNIAAPILQDEMDSADVVVGSFGPAVLYHLGRVDVIVGIDHMPHGDARPFAPARQMGRPVIVTSGALATLMDCHRTGLVVGIGPHWDQPWGVTEPLIRLLEARAEPVSLPESANVHAYRWSTEDPGAPPEDCPEVGGAVRPS